VQTGRLSGLPHPAQMRSFRRHSSIFFSIPALIIKTPTAVLEARRRAVSFVSSIILSFVSRAGALGSTFPGAADP
jgi:hypothetical protein